MKMKKDPFYIFPQGGRLQVPLTWERDLGRGKNACSVFCILVGGPGIVKNFRKEV
jgi:hypothetical protein